jgi:hypothetical protein
MTKPIQVSSNQVAKNAPIFLVAGSPELVDLDPAYVRIVSGDLASQYAQAYLSGSDYGGGSGGSAGTSVPTPTPATPKGLPKLNNWPPNLSDIEVYKQEIDYTVSLPKVVITFRVYNSTERTVTGLNMLVPKQ